MKRSACLVVVALAGVSLLAICATAGPMTTESASFKAAVDAIFRSWADFHLNSLESRVYDRYDLDVDVYQLLGDVGWARGSYAIVTRGRCDGALCTDSGLFQTVFAKQADGSWRVSTHTTISRTE